MNSKSGVCLINERAVMHLGVGGRRGGGGLRTFPLDGGTSRGGLQRVDLRRGETKRLLNRQE